MRFDFFPYQGSWLPIVPIIFGNKKLHLPAVLALVDTGATHTILPIEMAASLGIEVDQKEVIHTQVAGGGECLIYPSPVALAYCIRDPNSHLESKWHGPVFFAAGQQMPLLGHHQCLEKFDVMFKGPEKMLELLPRFKTESIGRKSPRKR